MFAQLQKLEKISTTMLFLAIVRVNLGQSSELGVRLNQLLLEKYQHSQLQLTLFI